MWDDFRSFSEELSNWLLGAIGLVMYWLVRHIITNGKRLDKLEREAATRDAVREERDKTLFKMLDEIKERLDRVCEDRGK